MITRPIREVLEAVEPPLLAVTSGANGRRAGTITTSLVPAVALDDTARIVIALPHDDPAEALIRSSGLFAAHLLAAGPEGALEDSLDILRAFGPAAAAGTDPFPTLPFAIGVTGVPMLRGSHSYVEARVTQTFEAGDLTLFVAAVLAGELRLDGPLLTRSMCNESLSAAPAV